MYEKILLTHDGSDLAGQAINHASILAKATGAEVIVLQVVDSVAQLMAQMTTGTIEPLPAGPLTAEIAQESVSGQHELAEQNLGHVRDALMAQGVEKVSMVVVEGRPEDAIVQAVQDLGADLVVISTHGRTGFRRAVMGSVADHVIRNTPGAPVLVVHLD
ncbi:MAG: universal stress protein [Dehalococcoidia bacterium]